MKRSQKKYYPHSLLTLQLMESQSYIKKFTPKLNINQKLESVVYDALEEISSFSFIGSVCC